MEYTPDQQRVAEYIFEATNGKIGAGDDPIGSLIASHADFALLALRALDLKHIIVQDTDGHFYVIPQSKRIDFGQWIASEDAEDGTVPEWADSVSGSVSRVVFGDYKIG